MLKVEVKSLSRVRLFETPWTVAHQASPSMEFSRQEYWSGLPFPSPGNSPFLETTFPYIYNFSGASLGAQTVKCLPAMWERPGFDPWLSKIPWSRQWPPTPVLLPRKFHGWRSLVGYSPWGCKESDTTERLHFHFHL